MVLYIIILYSFYSVICVLVFGVGHHEKITLLFSNSTDKCSQRTKSFTDNDAVSGNQRVSCKISLPTGGIWMRTAPPLLFHSSNLKPTGPSRIPRQMAALCIQNPCRIVISTFGVESLKHICVNSLGFSCVIDYD